MNVLQLLSLGLWKPDTALVIFPDMILKSLPLYDDLSAASNSIAGKVHLLCGCWSGAKLFIRDLRQASSGLFHFRENHRGLLPKVWHSTDMGRSLRWWLASLSQSNRTNMGHIHHKEDIGLEGVELEYELHMNINMSFRALLYFCLNSTFWSIRHLESDELLKIKIEKGHQYKLNQKWKISLLNAFAFPFI